MVIYESNDKDVKPYWNSKSKKINKSLWLPTFNTLNKSKEKSSKTLKNTWFSSKIQKISKNNVHEHKPNKRIFTIQDNTTLEFNTKTIKILPKIVIDNRGNTFDQPNIINRWFGIARLYYNKTIHYLQNNEITSFYSLRKIIMGDLNEKHNYVKDIPYEIKDGAIKDAHIAMFNAIKLSKKTKKWVELSYRSKKDLTQSIFLPKNSVKKNGFYIRLLKEMKYSEPIKQIDSACRLCYKRHIGYYLLVPQKNVQIKKSKENKEEFVSIDPGIRTFATCYSPKYVLEFGNNDIKRIERLHNHVDNMISNSKKVKCKKRQKILKNAYKLRLKIQNLVKELHWKTSKILCKKFKNIFIPIFETQKMVNKSSRKLNNTSSRNLLTMSHYLFRMRLIHQSKKYNSNVYIVNEAYTSKTCSNCGKVNDKLGSSKIFKCKECKMEMDRDVNGARGIYLRQMSIRRK